jgi:hypothetical protein
MSVPAKWLRNLYAHQGDFYMLVLPGAIVLCDPPKELERLYDIKGAKESVVRLFTSAAEADRFRDGIGNLDARVMKTTLVGFFSMIPRINSLSMRQYKVPVRVEICTLDSESCPRAIDTIHSTYELLS